MVLIIGKEVGQKGLVEVRGIETGEDLGVEGEQLGQAAQNFRIMGFGLEALSLIGGWVDDDEVIRCLADQPAPGLE